MTAQPEAATTIPITDAGVRAFAAQWPPIEVDDKTRAWTTKRAAELLAERDARAALHRERIRHEVHRAGGQVARGEITLEAADRRIDQLVLVRDEHHPVRVFLVPYREADTIAVAAFTAGVRSARKAKR